MEPDEALRGRRILVVEDDYLVAQSISEVLRAAGAEVSGPIGWIDEAVDFIEHHASAIDSAVVDINLHGEKSYQIADALTRSGIWFVFTTGYDTDEVSEPYQDHPRCIKPFQAPALIAMLAPLLQH